MSRRNRNRNREKKTMENGLVEKNMMDSLADWTEIRTMPVGVLEINEKYQRRIKWWWVNDIVSNFKRDLVATIQVSERDGHFYIMDGQHTTLAIKKKFADDNFPVVCKIYHGLTEKEEAEFFYEFNNSKSKLSSADNLKAQANYDEEAQAFLNRTRRAGFIIDPARRVSGKCGIRAVRKAQRCYEVLGAEKYDRMLRLLKAAWLGEPWSVTQNMLGGACRLLQVFGDKVDDAVFISQMKNVTENQIIKEAGRYPEESVPVAYASALVNYYNKGIRRTKQLKRTLLLED